MREISEKYCYYSIGKVPETVVIRIKVLVRQGAGKRYYVNADEGDFRKI